MVDIGALFIRVIYHITGLQRSKIPLKNPPARAIGGPDKKKTPGSSSIPAWNGVFGLAYFLPTLMVICLGCAWGCLGMEMFSTPFSKLASTLSVSSVLGSRTLRWNDP